MPAPPVISATQWRERAAALKPRTQAFIDGPTWIDAGEAVEDPLVARYPGGSGHRIARYL
jgi:hypothetical protein